MRICVSPGIRAAELSLRECTIHQNVQISSIIRINIALPLSIWALRYKKRSQSETSAQKPENLRIDAFSPLSFPDFNRSAGNSILRRRLTCRECLPRTVGIREYKSSAIMSAQS